MWTRGTQNVAIAMVSIGLAAMLVGFSTMPPMGLLQSDDHVQVAAWYEDRAVELREYA